ncbi:26S proteasome non-ATPase regulatory subunit 8 [Drosophila tropicalis]|uniref:26S proteasome non-ATPase regulatory subunit 8 n=1 Tax=Drosophila tropicalis TaxID=46794 RepID=UPI0035AB74F0
MSNLFKELKNEWAKHTPNLAHCAQLLDVLKLELVHVGFAGPKEAAKSGHNEKLQTSREMLEIAVEHSIKVKDYPAYERYMAQLNVYYYDYDKFLESSPAMHKFIGLNLLYMLATNRIADFHILLERLPTALLLHNSFIMPVLELENYFMEGRYNKILQAKKTMPSEIYSNFMDMLVNTAKEEIASCLEKSCVKIAPKQAALRLGLKPGSPELTELTQRRKWSLDADGNYNFANLHAKPVEVVPANDIAEQTLVYAQELEKIV